MNAFRNLLIITILSTVFYVVATFAAEEGIQQQEQTTDEPNSNKVESNNQVRQKIGKRGQVKTLEEFIPSEEVSADKPVAFPTDI